MSTRVKVQLGFTKNLGNFENARVDVGLEDDQREGESIDAAQERVYKQVESELIKRLTEVVEEMEAVS